MTPPASPGQRQLSEAIAFLQQGQFAAAEAVLLAILKRRPRDFSIPPATWAISPIRRR
ncbi:MAG: hypothetical protein ACK5TQ_07415 [Acetobacteraceae bacterium]